MWHYPTYTWSVHNTENYASTFFCWFFNVLRSLSCKAHAPAKHPANREWVIVIFSWKTIFITILSTTCSTLWYFAEFITNISFCGLKSFIKQRPDSETEVALLFWNICVRTKPQNYDYKRKINYKPFKNLQATLKPK